MKKYYLLASLSIFCFACGNNAGSSADASKDTAKTASNVMDSPDWVKGERLVAKSDCFTCHKLNDVSIGPSYAAVSAKYENNEANQSKLADKVISGGTGVWGQVAMTPHPALPKEDAIAMVKYVLLQKEVKK